MTDEPQRPVEADDVISSSGEEPAESRPVGENGPGATGTPLPGEEPAEGAPRRESGSEQLAVRRNGTAIACVGCMSAIVLGMLAAILLFAVSTRDGTLPEPLRQGEIATCSHQMEELTDALQRYRNKHDSYPEHLHDLWPDFLTDESVLWCPADDARKGPTSYDYIRPAPDAPQSDIVLKCRFHATKRTQLTLAATLGGEVLHLRGSGKSSLQPSKGEGR